LQATGRLKLTNDTIIWKSDKTGKVEEVTADNIETANYQRFVGHFGLRIFMKTGSLYRFTGFKEDEKKLAEFFKKHYNLEMLEKELSMRGWNWGTVHFSGDVLSFNINEKSAFEIPLSNVSQCTTGKNEVTLEFHQNDNAPVSLMEMRYHIPTSESSETDPVDAFYEKIIKKASVLSMSGDAIAVFKEIQCLTPRYVAYIFMQPVSNVLLFILVVATTSKFSRHSFNCTAKRSITKYRSPLCFVYSCCRTRTIVKCFSSSH
jgi:structure-specific recognition protein 1